MTAQTQVIIDLISYLGWDGRQELGWPVVPGPYVPPEPDRLLIITGAGGPGYLTDEASVDASIFQARVRGAPDDPIGAETAASTLDDMLAAASRTRFPLAIDGTSVNTLYRSGSGPTALPYDPSDRRTEFTCNYVIVTGV